MLGSVKQHVYTIWCRTEDRTERFFSMCPSPTVTLSNAISNAYIKWMSFVWAQRGRREREKVLGVYGSGRETGAVKDQWDFHVFFQVLPRHTNEKLRFRKHIHIQYFPSDISTSALVHPPGILYNALVHPATLKSLSVAIS